MKIFPQTAKEWREFHEALDRFINEVKLVIERWREHKKGKA